MRYQYTSRGYINNVKNIPHSGVNILILVNIIVFLLLELIIIGNYDIYRSLFYNFSLIPDDVYGNMHVWQCFTYLFLHGGIIHLLFNMLGLWFLGSELENLWGKKTFLEYYFITGIVAGVLTVTYNILFANAFIPIIGASGAIYGLLIAYGIIFPNRIIYIYGIFPVKVKNAVIVMGVIALFYSITLEKSGISHITHLSGMISGIIYLWAWKNKKKSVKTMNIHRSETQEKTTKQTINEILDKINELGWESLTEEERQFLKKESQNYNFNEPPN